MTDALDPWQRAVLAATGKSAQTIARETGLSLTTVNRIRGELRAMGIAVPVIGWPKGRQRNPERVAQIAAWMQEGVKQTVMARRLGITPAAVSILISRHLCPAAIKFPPVAPKRPFVMAVMQRPHPLAHLMRQTSAVRT